MWINSGCQQRIINTHNDSHMTCARHKKQCVKTCARQKNQCVKNAWDFCFTSYFATSIFSRSFHASFHAPFHASFHHTFHTSFHPTCHACQFLSRRRSSKLPPPIGRIGPIKARGTSPNPGEPKKTKGKQDTLHRTPRTLRAHQDPGAPLIGTIGPIQTHPH